MNLLLVLFQTKSYSLKISQNIDIGKLCICIIPTLKRRENVVQSCFSELGGAKFYLKLNVEFAKENGSLTSELCSRALKSTLYNSKNMHGICSFEC